MSEQTWNFTAIQAGADEIRASATRVHALLDEGKASLAKLSAVWGGSGSEAYRALQTKWDQEATRLTNAQDKLGAQCARCAEEMHTTETQVTSLFQG